jgi:2-methylisocitrate lyase-like PEP mutase family enzyme
MTKLLDMFTQARRAQSSSGMGFLGKNRSETKPRAAALVVELTTADAGRAEAAIKAGADGLLFAWGGKDTDELETLKSTVDAAKANNEKVVCGLHITGGWDKLERESLEQLKEQGINYVVLPIQAPARLLALKIKELDLVVTIPMREGDMYPIFIRNLTAFDTIAAVQLDFESAGDLSELTIEDMLQYRAVREAVRFPALLNVNANLSEADAFTLTTLGVQAVVLMASGSDDKTKKQISALRVLLEKVHQEDKDKTPPVIKA